MIIYRAMRLSYWFPNYPSKFSSHQKSILLLVLSTDSEVSAFYFACVLLGYIFHRLKDIIWQYPWKAIAIIHIYFSRYFNTTNNFTTNKLLTVVSKTFIWKYSSKTLKKLYDYRRNFSKASQYHEDYYAGLTDRN